MVGTLFLCVDIMYSQSNKTPKGANGNVGESGEAMTQSPAGSRQAA